MNKVDGYENGTIQSVTFMIEGIELERFLEKWLGTILWIGVSLFRKNHKRKNWYVGVFELTSNIIEEVNEKNFKFQYMRSKGAGGQHVNKVSSAVRATCPKTGISVSVMDTRSQHQNKKIAISRLKEKLYTYQFEQLSKDVEEEWKNHTNIRRGNPIRVFKGSDFKRNTVVKSYKKQRSKSKSDLRLEF